MGYKQRVSRAIALTIACSLAGIGWYARRRLKFRFKYSTDLSGLVWFEPKYSPFYLLTSKFAKEV